MFAGDVRDALLVRPRTNRAPSSTTPSLGSQRLVGLPRVAWRDSVERHRREACRASRGSTHRPAPGRHRAPVTGWFARRRYRSPVVWFALAALTGPIATILLAVAPPGRCPNCRGARRGLADLLRPLPRPAARRRDADRARGAARQPARQLAPQSAQPWAHTLPADHPATASILERAAIVAPPTPIDAARAGHRRDARPTSLGTRRAARRHCRWRLRHHGIGVPDRDRPDRAADR